MEKGIVQQTSITYHDKIRKDDDSLMMEMRDTLKLTKARNRQLIKLDKHKIAKKGGIHL